MAESNCTNQQPVPPVVPKTLEAYDAQLNEVQAHCEEAEKHFHTLMTLIRASIAILKNNGEGFRFGGEGEFANDAIALLGQAVNVGENEMFPALNSAIEATNA